jgi:hypothetical protein
MGTSLIDTDAGRAYIKALGNRQGPHPLACEWVASLLADWFGLPTFDFAIMMLEDVDTFDLPRGARTRPGPAFVTRAAAGRPWSGKAEDLGLLENTEHIARLVVFDTWTSNCDRHPPDLAKRKPNRDNVFLCGDGAAAGRYRLVAMDNTHCFTCGGDLSERVANIDRVQDGRVYGLFPEFVPYITPERVAASTADLRRIDAPTVDGFVGSIPREWEVSSAATGALREFILRRAAWVADTIPRLLTAACESGRGPDGAGGREVDRP